MNKLMSTTSRLRVELEKVNRNKQNNFSGIGLIVWDIQTKIPIFPLRASHPSLADSLSESLQLLAVDEGIYHDGFHVVDSNMKMRFVSQYFSPPIPENISIFVENCYGGRFYAAKFGSLVPGVLLTAVLTKTYGPTIFCNGEVI